MGNSFHTIVIGLGAMGSAAAYQLAKRGGRVLAIDQFAPPHDRGSSHGDTRITRQAIGEGEQYTPLSLRSYEIWREIEKQSGESLLTITGGLITAIQTTSAPKPGSFFGNTVAAARTFGIRHELLDATQLRARFPQFHVHDDEVGYYEYNAGLLRPEACVRTQIALARQYGAEIHTNERVRHFADHNGAVRVTTDRGREYVAQKLILSAGPWLPTMIRSEYADLFTVIRQVLYWFDVKDAIEPFLPAHCPVFIKRGVYGFPALDGPGGGIKVAHEQHETTTTADTVDRKVSREEIRAMYERFVAPHFPGLSDRCLRAVSCLYTNTPDSAFVIDQHPDHPDVILASPCSGHGFKHSAAVGEVLAQLAMDGESNIDIHPFRLNRFLLQQ